MASPEPPDDSNRRLKEGLDDFERETRRLRAINDRDEQSIGRRRWFRGIREALLGIMAATALFIAVEKSPTPPPPPPTHSIEQSIEKLNTATTINYIQIKIFGLRDSAKDLNVKTIESIKDIKDKVLELSKLPCAAAFRAEIEDTVRELHLDEVKRLPKGERLDKKEIEDKLLSLTVKIFEACAKSLHPG